MQSHCALYVDAGYLLTAAATRVTGTSLRGGVAVDYQRLIAELIKQTTELCGLPLLRVNWYDSARNAVPDTQQEQIGLIPKVKVRLGRIGHNGEQKGVDMRIGIDLVSHARNGAAEVMYLVSGDDDLTEAVEEAQAHGVQVIVLAVPDASGHAHGVSGHLRRAADNLELVAVDVIDCAVTGAAAAPLGPTKPTGVPTPADLASHRRIAPAPPIAAPVRADAALAYSSASGGTDHWDHNEGLSSEVIKTTEDVAERVLRIWLNAAGAADRRALIAGRPSIPREIDKALLIDLSGALGGYDLTDQKRFELRRQFWDRVDQAEELAAAANG